MRSLFTLVVAVAMFGCSPAADGVQVQVDAGAALDAACVTGRESCDGRCVDLSSNALNCGACGRACQPSESCVQGACAMVCPDGQTACGGRCVSVASNALNCGACGRACPAGEACIAGSCSAQCSSPRTVCEGVCVDPRSDASNCGACGQACAAGQACQDSLCRRGCPADQVDCGGTCASTRTDGRNCGRCGAVCPGGTTCVDGTCSAACGAGRTACGAACVDTATDPSNCGACGGTCAAGQSCAGGMCRASCASPTTSCGGLCVDTATHGGNCGRCGNACPSGQNCVSGVCRAPVSSVRATWTFPGTLPNPVTRDLRFPTYLAHAFGLVPDGTLTFRFQTACAALTNSGAASQQVTLEARMPGYASARTQVVTLAAGESRSVCVNPVFDLARLYSLTAISAGALEADARDAVGNYIARDSRTVAILPLGGVVWSEPGYRNSEMSALSIVHVAPFDPSILSLRRAVETRSVFPGGFGASGYGRTPIQRARTIAARGNVSHVVFLEQNEDFLLQLNTASGGSVNLYLFTPTQFEAWQAGTGNGVLALNNTVGAGATLRYRATAAGYAYAVIHNVDTASSRTVTFTPSNSRQDVAYDALGSIYEELRSRNFSYTNIGTAYYASEQVQYIRRPRDLLATRTGNCIEGSILFASVLENIGMEPVIFRVPGHAFVGVRSAPGSTVIWPVETTMLGVAAFATAFTTGIEEIGMNATLPAEEAHFIDVTNARRAGLRPIPM